MFSRPSLLPELRAGWFACPAESRAKGRAAMRPEGRSALAEGARLEGLTVSHCLERQ